MAYPLAVLKEYNLKHHYLTKHGEHYEKYKGDDRWKRGLLSQQELFHKAGKDADAAFEANYVVSDLIAKVGPPFMEGQFLKDCMLRIADILCPEKKSLFNNVALSTNSMGERTTELFLFIYIILFL